MVEWRGNWPVQRDPVETWYNNAKPRRACTRKQPSPSMWRLECAQNIFQELVRRCHWFSKRSCHLWSEMKKLINWATCKRQSKFKQKVILCFKYIITEAVYQCCTIYLSLLRKKRSQYIWQLKFAVSIDVVSPFFKEIFLNWQKTCWGTHGWNQF